MKLLSWLFPFATIIVAITAQIDPNVPRYCTPTGPSVCNFGVAMRAPLDFAGWTYDRDCNLMGQNLHLTYDVPYVTGRYDQYPIFMNLNDPSFTYNGVYHKIDSEDCWCYDARDKDFKWACQCAYICSNTKE
jgi:hypothetical protein